MINNKVENLLKKYSRKFTPIVGLLVSLPNLAKAQIFSPEPTAVNEASERAVGGVDLVSRFLIIGLGIAGLIMVVMLLWGTFKFITSQGDESQVNNARGAVINAIIGIVIVLLAYSLVRILTNALTGGVSGL